MSPLALYVLLVVKQKAPQSKLQRKKVNAEGISYEMHYIVQSEKYGIKMLHFLCSRCHPRKDNCRRNRKEWSNYKL
jgi:hypothetical protein